MYTQHIIHEEQQEQDECAIFTLYLLLRRLTSFRILWAFLSQPVSRGDMSEKWVSKPRHM